MELLASPSRPLLSSPTCPSSQPKRTTGKPVERSISESSLGGQTRHSSFSIFMSAEARWRPFFSCNFRCPVPCPAEPTW